MDDFWHKNLDRISHITSSFIEDFASANLPIKATQARGYKSFLCFIKKVIVSGLCCFYRKISWGKIFDKRTCNVRNSVKVFGPEVIHYIFLLPTLPFYHARPQFHAESYEVKSKMATTWYLWIVLHVNAEKDLILSWNTNFSHPRIKKGLPVPGCKLHHAFANNIANSTKSLYCPLAITQDQETLFSC